MNSPLGPTSLSRELARPRERPTTAQGRPPGEQQGDMAHGSGREEATADVAQGGGRAYSSSRQTTAEEAQWHSCSLSDRLALEDACRMGSPPSTAQGMGDSTRHSGANTEVQSRAGSRAYRRRGGRSICTSTGASVRTCTGTNSSVRTSMGIINSSSCIGVVAPCLVLLVLLHAFATSEAFLLLEDPAGERLSSLDRNDQTPHSDKQQQGVTVSSEGGDDTVTAKRGSRITRAPLRLPLRVHPKGAMAAPRSAAAEATANNTVITRRTLDANSSVGTDALNGTTLVDSALGHSAGYFRLKRTIDAR